MRNNYYVSCWHMNQHENKRMWKCYTTSPDAVAVKTTYAALRNSISNYVEMGVVRYMDYAKEALPTMNMYEYIMHKDEHYRFEKEVRAVVHHPQEGCYGYDHFKDNIFEKNGEPGFYIYAPQVSLNQLIHEVILHPDAPTELEIEVKQLCKKAGIPQPKYSRTKLEH